MIKAQDSRKYEVDIDAANKAKAQMRDILDVGEKRLINKVGAFASLYDISDLPYRRPILVLKTEEPGSKQLIAARYDRIEGVCYDMIHHLINDCIAMGATPLTVQDAVICGKLDTGVVTRIVSALASACEAQGCVLTGGETSEQPGVLPPDAYILTSSIVGVVESDEIIDGSRICSGDVVLSLESSGIHTNGYTLVRRLMADCPAIMDEKVDGRAFIDAILEPHRCYYHALRELFATGLIKGLAHITGGGIRENLDRILPAGTDALIDLSLYDIPAVFKLLRRYGQVSDEEMLRTFNLGCGMAVVCEAGSAPVLTEHFARHDLGCSVIGRITGEADSGAGSGMGSGTGRVLTEGALAW